MRNLKRHLTIEVIAQPLPILDLPVESIPLWKDGLIVKAFMGDLGFTYILNRGDRVDSMERAAEIVEEHVNDPAILYMIQKVLSNHFLSLGYKIEYYKSSQGDNP